MSGRNEVSTTLTGSLPAAQVDVFGGSVKSGGVTMRGLPLRASRGCHIMTAKVSSSAVPCFASYCSGATTVPSISPPEVSHVTCCHMPEIEDVTLRDPLQTRVVILSHGFSSPLYISLFLYSGARNSYDNVTNHASKGFSAVTLVSYGM